MLYAERIDSIKEQKGQIYQVIGNDSVLTEISVTRYDYNLTIMKSPKPDTDNRFKKLIKSYLWNRTMLNWRPVEIFRCRESIQDVEIEQLWICAVLWWPFSKWRPVEIFQCRDIIIYPHINVCWYRTMLNIYRRFFMPCFGSHSENSRHLENFEDAELVLWWWPITM